MALTFIFCMRLSEVLFFLKIRRDVLLGYLVLPPGFEMPVWKPGFTSVSADGSQHGYMI